MKTFKMIFILSFFLISFIKAQSNLANIWINSGNINRSYHINDWSEISAIKNDVVFVNGRSIIKLGGINANVLINTVPNSSPSYTPHTTLPYLSLVGLSGAIGAIGEDWSKPMLSISPNGGDFNETIEVTLTLIAPNGFDGVAIYSIDNKQPIKTRINSKNNTLSFYIYKKGTHTVTYQLQNYGSSKTVTFTIVNNQDDNKKDSDGDGIPDSVEAELGLDPLDGSMQDSDGNGWSDFDEILRGHDLTDSDGDGWLDWDEINLRYTDKDNNRSKPTAHSLYGVEYNVTSKAYDNNKIKKPLYRVSFMDISSAKLYDSLELLDINLTKEYYNMAISHILHSDLNKSLSLGNIPTIRIPADTPIIERVQEDNNDTNSSWVVKSFISSTQPLSLKAYYKEFNQTAISGDVNASTFINGFISYLKSNLIVPKDIRVDKNSSVGVALLESAFNHRDESNSTILLGNPTLSTTNNAYANILKALSLEENRDINQLYSNLQSILDNSLKNSLLSQFSSTSSYTTEMRLAKYMKEKLTSRQSYKIALMTIVSYQKAQQFPSVFTLSNDSDGDGLSNKDEVMPIRDYSNPLEADSDKDGIEDSQDPCINDSDNSCMNSSNSQTDSDGDGVVDTVDNCPFIKNPNQNDSDGDGIGDECSRGDFLITNPRTTLHLLQGDSFTFEATQLNPNATPQWFIGIEPLPNSNTLRYQHFFTSAGSFNICIKNGNCIPVKVSPRNMSNAKLNIFAQSKVKEGDNNHTILVELELAKPLSFAVDYMYQTIDNTTTANNDYQSVSGHVLFKPNETRKFIPITIIGDNDYEDNESFIFKADRNSTDFNQTEITIINDDVKVIVPDPIAYVYLFEWDRYNNKILIGRDTIEGEFDKNITFSLELDKPITKEGSVHYELLPIPVSTTSYNSMVRTPIEGDLTFEIGDKKKEFNITIIGDFIHEFDNNFTIRLSNPVNIELENSQNTDDTPITIVDNDIAPIVSFKNTHYKVTEGDHIQLELKLSSKSYTPVEVNLTLDENSDAEDSLDVDDDDFNLSTYNIVFPFSTPTTNNTIFKIDLNISENPDDSDGEKAIFDINRTTSAFISHDKNSTIVEIYEKDSPTPPARSLIPTHAFIPFDGSDGHGLELWDSNGTINGTALFADIVEGMAESEPREITRVGNKLIYFVAKDRDIKNILCVTNGVEGNVTILHNFGEDLVPSSLVAVDDKLYFTVTDMDMEHGQANSHKEIWSSEGDKNSTHFISRVLDGPTEPEEYFFAKLGKLLLFGGNKNSNSTSDVELYKLDTTTDTISLVKDIKQGEDGSFPGTDEFGGFAINGNKLYFTTLSSGIWETDGTESGTQQIITDRGIPISGMVISNDILYYSINSYPDAKLEGVNLADGTTYNIREYHDGGNISSLEAVYNMTPYLLYTYASSSGYTLVKVDVGTATDIEMLQNFPYPVTTFNGLFYYALDGALYVTDGDTPSVLLRDKRSDSESISFVKDSINDKLFFRVDDYNSGTSHLWVTDSFVGGTMQLK